MDMNGAAYEIKQLNTYSVQIQCIAAYDDYLVVGNCLGHVLWYETNPRQKLLYADKTFSKKSIMQLAAVSELQTVVCLSAERGVSLLRFSVSPGESARCDATDLQYTRGANCFAFDVKALAVGTRGSGSGKKSVRLCVAVKKQLNLYVWNDKQFLQFPSIDTTIDAPRTLMWCGQSIVVGCKNEYFLINVDTKHVCPLILTGTCVEPSIVKMSDTEFGLVKDSQLVVMSTAAGEASKEQIIELDDTPYSIAYDAPYLLVGFGDTLRVQTAEPYDGNCVVRQDITTNNRILKISCSKNGLIYAMSKMNIWRLKPVQLGVQIDRLLKEKHYQLALTLTDNLDESVNDKEKKKLQIRELHAINLFDKKKYQESIKEFSKLNVDFHFVIELFLNSLPQSDLEDHENETVDEETDMRVNTLIKYLTNIRRNLSNQLSDNDCQTDGGDETDSDNKEELLEAIDNALLKCYLQTNDALIAPIIRLNHCRLSETETTLKNHKKYNELIILYQVKEMHLEALNFLKQQSIDPASTLYGPEKIIQYLQHMDPKDIDVVLECSDWLADRFPGRVLEVFTADVGDAEQWPRWRVYGHLTRMRPDLCAPYLEHVTHVWNETGAAFHDALIRLYTESLRKRAAPPGTKAKLLAFLEQSDYYSLEKALERFPIRDECFEERIKVLGKLGRHEQILTIFVYKLNDVDRAIEHCDKVYASRDKNSDQIYVKLLRLLNRPPDSWLAEIGRVPRLAPDLEKTIEILNKYTTVISISDALTIISDDIPIHRIGRYLVTALEAVVSDKRLYQLNRGLLFSWLLQMQKQEVFYASQKFVLTKHSKCSVCKKLIGSNSAFVKCLDGNILHLSCYNNQLSKIHREDHRDQN